MSKPAKLEPEVLKKAFGADSIDINESTVTFTYTKDITRSERELQRTNSEYKPEYQGDRYLAVSEVKRAERQGAEIKTEGFDNKKAGSNVIEFNTANAANVRYLDIRQSRHHGGPSL